ncbi:MAG: hypothetical protein ACOZNI_15420 [Myxococcota bacterium]
MRFLLAIVALAGCPMPGRDISYEGGDGGDDTDVVATTCGEDVDRSKGFSVEGTTLDLGTGGTATAGLCISAVDPTPAITGGEPTVLGSSEVCDDGNFVVAGIESAPSIGMFLLIDDCDDATGDTVMLTATGIPPEAIAELGDGDSLTGVEALSVSLEWLAVMQADLETVGWSGDLGEAGYMAGVVEDAEGNPVSGAHVASPDPYVTYYEDATAEDGIYGAGATANTETSADAGGLFMIPDAPIFTYTCEDGGAHEWESTLLGSLPGYAVYIRFTAQ